MLHQPLLWHLLATTDINATNTLSNGTLWDANLSNQSFVQSLNSRRQSVTGAQAIRQSFDHSLDAGNASAATQTNAQWYDGWYIHTLCIIIALLVVFAVTAGWFSVRS